MTHPIEMTSARGSTPPTARISASSVGAVHWHAAEGVAPPSAEKAVAAADAAMYRAKHAGKDGVQVDVLGR